MKPFLLKRKITWRLFMLGLVMTGAVVANHGCASWVAHGLVDAPNAGVEIDAHDDPPAVAGSEHKSATHLRIAVGPPAASLSMVLVEPDAAVKGTILVLHGIRDSKSSQAALGRTLAAAGFRAVLVDLRGHGRSSGDWLTYGVVESRDLMQVIDQLEHRADFGPIGVFGSSYGGSIGIQLAALDARVQAVVAVAPFASVRDLICAYARHVGLGWFIGESTAEKAFRQASQLAGCDLSRADPIQSIGRTAALVLLVHGREDAHIPFEHSQRLHAAGGARTRLILLEGEDHYSIMADRRGVVGREALAWFERHLRQ